MGKTIYDMSELELKNLLLSKEVEYKEAMKAKKVFWEVKKIVEQKREIEKLLIKKKTGQLS